MAGSSKLPNLSPQQIALAESFMKSKFGDSDSFSYQSVNKLEIVDKLFPPQTLYQFFDFAFEGKLPVGNHTSLPLLTEDEVPLLSAPYSTWAPAPYNQMPSSITESVLALVVHEGLVATLPRKIHAMKARLWGGMIPMSGNRWKEKRLDDPKNHLQAVEFIAQLLWVFRYLSNPPIQAIIRKGFNLISAELAKCQSAINVRRAERNAAPLNLTGLWVEFIESLFTVMTTRTHSWIIARHDELHRRAKAEYEATADDGSDAAFAAGKSFVNVFQDLNNIISRADFMIAMPMDGFEGYQELDSSLPEAVEDRETLYYALTESLPWTAVKKLVEETSTTGGEPGSAPNGFRNRQTCLDVYNEGREARQKVRLEFRGQPSQIGQEHWISILKSRIDWSLKHGGPTNQDWGFVAYRLSYKETPEEWEQFLTKLTADFKRSGEWIDGSDDIRNTAGLQWLDGKELGIPENDVAAAKRHFERFRQSAAILPRMWKQDFIVVNFESVLSYLGQVEQQADQKPYGDYGGHVRLVDTMFQAIDPQVIKELAPGYKGEVKVLGSLVFDDVYPLIASLAQRTIDLWPLAILHPSQVYTGPTIPSQEMEWEQMRQIRSMMFGSFFQFLKAGKKPEEK